MPSSDVDHAKLVAAFAMVTHDRAENVDIQSARAILLDLFPGKPRVLGPMTAALGMLRSIARSPMSSSAEERVATQLSDDFGYDYNLALAVSSAAFEAVHGSKRPPHARLVSPLLRNSRDQIPTAVGIPLSLCKMPKITNRLLFFYLILPILLVNIIGWSMTHATWAGTVKTFRTVVGWYCYIGHTYIHFVDLILGTSLEQHGLIEIACGMTSVTWAWMAGIFWTIFGWFSYLFFTPVRLIDQILGTSLERYRLTRILGALIGWRVFNYYLAKWTARWRSFMWPEVIIDKRD